MVCCRNEINKYVNSIATGMTYREGANGGGGELGELKLLLLDLLADGEGAPAVKHVGGDSSDTLPDGIVGVALESTTSSDGSLVGLVRRSDLGVLGAGEDGGNHGNLASLLEGEREPVLLLSGKLVLSCEGDRGVEEGRRGGNNDTLSAEDTDSLLAELHGRGNISLPDVTARNNTEREDEIGGLDGLKDGDELFGGTVQVNVETGDAQLGNDVDIALETAVVGGKHDRGGNGDKLAVRGDERALVVGSDIENEEGLIDLDPVSTSGLELGQELLVDREELGEEGDGLEARLSLLGSLTEDEERDGAENDGAGRNTGGLGLLELLNCLVEKQLELGRLRELGDDKVVVRVEPGHRRSFNHHPDRWIRQRRVPLLHLGSRDIDTISLTATAHSEVDIKGRKVVAEVTLGDHVESGRVVENVVIEGEVTAKSRGQRHVPSI